MAQKIDTSESERLNALLIAGADLVQQVELNLRGAFTAATYDNFRRTLDTARESGMEADMALLLDAGRQLILDIEAQDPQDALGHRFVNNITFNRLKELVEEFPNTLSEEFGAERRV